jgi:large subunit ribosomal protein L30
MYKSFEKNSKRKMISIIRITGLVGVPIEAKETLNRLRLRKKYSCIIIRETPEILGMLKKIRNYVAYGKIDRQTLIELIEKRGKPLRAGKIDAAKVASGFIEAKTNKKLSDFGVKDFFSLHPPRKGIKSKIHYPKGVLGDNKEKIKDLIKRML